MDAHLKQDCQLLLQLIFLSIYQLQLNSELENKQNKMNKKSH